MEKSEEAGPKLSQREQLLADKAIIEGLLASMDQPGTSGVHPVVKPKATRNQKKKARQSQKKKTAKPVSQPATAVQVGPPSATVSGAQEELLKQILSMLTPHVAGTAAPPLVVVEKPPTKAKSPDRVKVVKPRAEPRTAVVSGAPVAAIQQALAMLSPLAASPPVLQPAVVQVPPVRAEPERPTYVQAAKRYRTRVHPDATGLSSWAKNLGVEVELHPHGRKEEGGHPRSALLREVAMITALGELAKGKPASVVDMWGSARTWLFNKRLVRLSAEAFKLYIHRDPIYYDTKDLARIADLEDVNADVIQGDNPVIHQSDLLLVDIYSAGDEPLNSDWFIKTLRPGGRAFWIGHQFNDVMGTNCSEGAWIRHDDGTITARPDLASAPYGPHPSMDWIFSGSRPPGLMWTVSRSFGGEDGMVMVAFQRVDHQVPPRAVSPTRFALVDLPLPCSFEEGGFKNWFRTKLLHYAPSYWTWLPKERVLIDTVLQKDLQIWMTGRSLTGYTFKQICAQARERLGKTETWKVVSRFFPDHLENVAEATATAAFLAGSQTSARRMRTIQTIHGGSMADHNDALKNLDTGSVLRVPGWVERLLYGGLTVGLTAALLLTKHRFRQGFVDIAYGMVLAVPRVVETKPIVLGSRATRLVDGLKAGIEACLEAWGNGLQRPDPNTTPETMDEVVKHFSKPGSSLLRGLNRKVFLDLVLSSFIPNRRHLSINLFYLAGEEIVKKSSWGAFAALLTVEYSMLVWDVGWKLSIPMYLPTLAMHFASRRLSFKNGLAMHWLWNACIYIRETLLAAAITMTLVPGSFVDSLSRWERFVKTNHVDPWEERPNAHSDVVGVSSFPPSAALVPSQTVAWAAEKEQDSTLIVEGEFSLEDCTRPTYSFWFFPHNQVGYSPRRTAAMLLTTLKTRILTKPPLQPLLQSVEWNKVIDVVTPTQVLIEWTEELFNEWLEGLDSAKKARALRAWKTVFETDYDRPLAVTLFVKTDELLFRRTDGGNLGLKPRCIANVPTEVQVLVGPILKKITCILEQQWDWEFSHPIPLLLGQEVTVTYAGKSTDARLSAWMRACLNLRPAQIAVLVSGDDSLVYIHDGGQWILIEADAEMFDQSQSFGPLQFEWRQLSLLGVPQRVLDLLRNVASAPYIAVAPNDCGRIKIRRENRPMRDTGGADTTLGNSLVMGAAWVHALGVNRPVAETFELLGLRMKIKYHYDWRGPTFLKGKWYATTTGDPWWSVLPSRYLKMVRASRDVREIYRLGDIREATERYAHDLSLSYAGFAAVPFVRAFIRKFRRQRSYYITPTEEPWKVQATGLAPDLDQVEMWLDIEQRYGIETIDGLLLEETIRLAPLFSFIEDPIFENLTVDYN